VDWLVVQGGVAVYAGMDEAELLQPVRTAQAGEWYRVERTQDGFALATLERDVTAVWLRIDPDPLELDGLRICP